MIVGVVQVIEDHQQALAAIAAAETSEGVAEFTQPFALAKQTAQAIRVHVLEAEELLGALLLSDGGPPLGIGNLFKRGQAAPNHRLR